MEGQTRPRRDGESEREQGQRVRSEVAALCVALSEHGRRRDPFTKRQMGERERDGGRESEREREEGRTIASIPFSFDFSAMRRRTKPTCRQPQSGNASELSIYYIYSIYGMLVPLFISFVQLRSLSCHIYTYTK